MIPIASPTIPKGKLHGARTQSRHRPPYFYDDGPFVFGHFAFLVDDARFEAILGRAVSGGFEHGSGPFTRDRSINRVKGGRGVYVWDKDGNSYEFFTADPLHALPQPPASPLAPYSDSGSIATINDHEPRASSSTSE